MCDALFALVHVGLHRVDLFFEVTDRVGEALVDLADPLVVGVQALGDVVVDLLAELLLERLDLLKHIRLAAEPGLGGFEELHPELHALLGLALDALQGLHLLLGCQRLAAQRAEAGQPSEGGVVGDGGRPAHNSLIQCGFDLPVLSAGLGPGLHNNPLVGILFGMKLSGVIQALEALAPAHLAEAWDQVGLHVGDPGQAISSGLLCIDLTEAVLDEAVRAKSNLIVAYHPPIFKPLGRLTTNDPKQRIIYRAARKGIAIYSPHTALDAAPDGVNDWLASGVGAGKVQTIKPAATEGDGPIKLVVFVPMGDMDAVRGALFKAGAGQLGAYSECSFSTAGTGTFHGDATSNPAIGKPGSFERVAEQRLEMLVPKGRLAAVVAALREAHPYEEPAFDLFQLLPSPKAGAAGQGRVVELGKPVPIATLVTRLKKHLGVKLLDVAWPGGAKKVRRVGLCAGAGGSLMGDAGPIDVFLTGEMRHHDVLEASAKGVGVVLAGHTQTERPYLSVYRKRLAKETGKAVQWRVSKADRPPSQLR